MENLLKEFFQPILLIAGIAAAGTVLIRFIPGSFDNDIFDSKIFNTSRHTIERKNFFELILAIAAIIFYFI